MSDTMSAGKHLGDAGDPDETTALTPVPEPAPEEQPIIVVAETKGARREVVCPECGTVATITVNRREAEDFCRRCDFPLFWTPAAIVLDTSSGPSSDALRRLPGTAGRVTVGKLDCPHCRESNPVTETHCLRCQGDLHPVLPPAPLPPPVLAPPPEPEPVPEKSTPWLLYVGIGLTVLLAIALILYFVL
ncbi:MULTISPECIES: hypothetical protein [unclassified Nocardioides]|uniref:hypothetical protein n=1 Tax=unclassified Nocardioides TaxID=2615069 RepID=UPI0030152A3D